MSPVYIWWADNGNIRKWSHEPFPEGTQYAPAQLDQAREEERERCARICDGWQGDEAAQTAALMGMDDQDLYVARSTARGIAAAIRTPDRTDGGEA